MIKGVVTIKSAAEILGVSIETLRKWDASGRLKALRDKESNYRVYRISELERFAVATNLRRPNNQRLKLGK